MVGIECSKQDSRARKEITCGVHYAASQQGKTATLTITVRVTDIRGNLVSTDLAVPVTST